MEFTTLPHWAQIAVIAIVAIVLLATLLVRLADIMESIQPHTLDPEHIKKAKAIVSRAGEVLGYVMLHFPTLFMDPKVQKMAKLNERLSKQIAEQPAQEKAPELPVGSSTVEADDKAS